MKMAVIVSSGCTRIFADGELIAYFMYEDEDAGIKVAKLYKAEKEFLTKQDDTHVITVLKEPKTKPWWQRILKRFV